MAEEEAFDADQLDSPPPRRRWRRLAGVLSLVLLALAAWAWFTREDIARNLIGSELAKRGVTATYRIERIGPTSQILEDIVIGDPARPDMTAERIEVAITTRWGLPAFGRVKLVRPRLYGGWKDGRLSFGALDPFIYTGSKEPAQLPDLDLALVDGRARIESPWGTAGVKAEGKGNLADGFSGFIAAITPKADAGGCSVERGTLFARLATASGRLRLAGPLRIGPSRCDGGLALSGATVGIDTVLDRHFDGAEGRFDLTGGAMHMDFLTAASFGGKGRLVWRDERLTGQYRLTAGSMASPQARLATLALDGTVRAAEAFSSIDVEMQAAGAGLAIGQGMKASLDKAQRAVDGTLAAPLLARLQSGLSRQATGGSLAARLIARKDGGSWSFNVPQAGVSGRDGAGLIALSRLQFADGGMTGNLTTGGADLPRITGRLERNGAGGHVIRLAMEEYRAGSASLTIPGLMLTESRAGAFALAGEVRLSGPLPGGHVRDLAAPVDGIWAPAKGTFALWQGCRPVRFASLVLSGLELSQDRLTLCPGGAGAIVRNGPGGLQVAAGVPSLNLAGRIGDSPVRIASGAIGLAWPGALSARNLDVAIGPPAQSSNFRITELAGRLGRQMAGRFSGAQAMLAAVPLDILEASGDWRVDGARLSVSDGALRLQDRQADARFQPLVAREAQLEFADGTITVSALLREPGSDREVVRADIVHGLSGGIGHADLHVAGLVFDKTLQPDTISRLALGVIANTRGRVYGTGRIDWTPDSVTSHGTAGSDSLDFAAAFGPVKGVSGTVEFTDLLGLVTAPDQRLKIASINPGIEAMNGELSFELKGNNLLVVNGANWPFLDGELRLEPTRMVLGAAEVRRYTLTIKGLDAAKLVNQLEMANISATGAFDGVLPLVFDENGGRIEGGELVSRGSGNLSYLGALTYRDLSPIANFAFDALRSLDYRQMRVELEGDLAGEIITRLKFDGVTQGAGARSNFLTKQVAKLPIRFNVNIRAPFFRLVSSFRSLYDPDFVTDPRLLGLIDKHGRPTGSQQTVQPSASGGAP